MILGGNFNCSLFPTLDRSSPNHISPKKSALTIQSFFSVSELWHFLYPYARQYYFHFHHTLSRTDYLFLDNKLLPLVRSCAYNSIVISDHAPLTLELTFPDQPAFHGPWCFNPLLLSDQNFTEFISSQIAFFFNTNRTPGISYSALWETMKAKPRHNLIHRPS